MSNLPATNADLEKTLAALDSLPTDFRIPAISIAKANSQATKSGLTKPGDFYDGETNRSLGTRITMVACDYRHIIRSYEEPGRKFLKSLYLTKEDYNPKNEQLIAFKNQQSADKKKKIVYDDAHDILVYIPELSTFRHFYMKGQLSKQTSLVMKQGLRRTPDGVLLFPVEYSTVHKEYNGHEWYILATEPTSFDPIQLDLLSDYLTAFNKVFTESSADADETSEDR